METKTMVEKAEVKSGGWDRSQLTLRLSPTRRSQLKALADADEELTPQQAIDRAIAVAHEARRMDAVAVAVDGRLAQWAVPPPFGEWLRSELARYGAESARSAVVRATWERSARLELRGVFNDFDCQLVAVDGKLLAYETGLTAGQARLGPVPSGAIGFLVDSGLDACLWCEPSRNGALRVVVHAFEANGTVGGALSEHHF